MIEALKGIGRKVVYTHCHNNDCSGLPFDTIAMYVASHADLFYTEYQLGEHDIWTESYDYPLLFPWVFDKHLITSVREIAGGELPRGFELKQNYPNPFNPSTTIRFSLPQVGFVSLKVFNTLGEEVATLVSEELHAGQYKTEWNAIGIASASGVYYYRMQYDGFIQTKKLILLR